jgi:hypothetical protein
VMNLLHVNRFAAPSSTSRSMSTMGYTWSQWSSPVLHSHMMLVALLSASSQRSSAPLARRGRHDARKAGRRGRPDVP